MRVGATACPTSVTSGQSERRLRCKDTLGGCHFVVYLHDRQANCGAIRGLPQWRPVTAGSSEVVNSPRRTPGRSPNLQGAPLLEFESVCAALIQALANPTGRSISIVWGYPASPTTPQAADRGPFPRRRATSPSLPEAQSPCSPVRLCRRGPAASRNARIVLLPQRRS